MAPCMSRSSTRLFICLVLSISLATYTNSVALENDANAPESVSPTCSSAALYYTNATTAPFFDKFLAAYTETVDTIVGLQTTTWNYIERYKSFDESTVEGLCERKNSAHLFTNIPKFARSLEQDQATFTEKTAKLKWDPPIDFNNDKESDIDGYFTELAEGCTKDIDSPVAAQTYTKECFNRIKDIVWEPKCTTRYDSRVRCDGRALPTELPTPSELIAEHFGSSAEIHQETLHVVIVGAGPIGLMLGNALSMLQRNQSNKNHIPPIKILYLETRAEAPGVKKPYTRNWQAHLSLLHFRDKIDPRVLRIIASMTEDKDDPESSTSGFVFPLNIIETLLMLSNRDLGASKFLFGVNPLDVVDDLKKVKNLLLIDATGHRLEPLRRGPACDGKGGEDLCENNNNEEENIILNHRTPSPPNIAWKNDQTRDFYENLLTFQQDFTGWHEMLEERGQYLHIGQSGDVMYPIDETTKAAKSMMWLDIHGALPLMAPGLAREVMAAKQSYDLYASEGPFCEWCKDWTNDEAEDFIPAMKDEAELNLMCNSICFVSYFSQSTSLLRGDINENIFNDQFRDTFVTHTDSWFPIMGYSFNPSFTLASVAEKVLVANGFGNHPIGMSLKQFYPALLKAIYHGNYTYVPGEDDDTGDYDDDQYESYAVDLSDADWELVEAIERYTYQATTTKWPTVTMYVQRPFIYTNGIKKKNRCGNGSSTDIGDYLEHAPMLRFGDSFTTGDGLAGAGFFTHATMIGVFMDLIRDKLSVASEMRS